MSDDLVSVVYTSTASRPFRQTALEHLLETCRRRNAEHDVTGMLLYRGDRFIQVLEGPRNIVSSLIETIRRDSRHHDLRVLLDDSVSRRRFADWTMGYQAFRDADRSTPPGYRDSFDDLDAGADHDTARRALAELTLWFRVRRSTRHDSIAS